ncbi:MAG: LPS export ABC transporter periplasmic protein LptC [Candidatus Omnitrophica bacterium]|nr:LPS export ABC transporter periplasmic protein LptC [Candidatus Omnitrophota bacterium]
MNKPAIRHAAVAFTAILFVCATRLNLSAQGTGTYLPQESLVVNGDTVEYFTDRKEMEATGSVVVDYLGTKLRCNKLTVNTQTKDCVAEGAVSIEDANGLMRGELIRYNFTTKKGSVEKATFYSEPYYGRSDRIELVSEKQFIAGEGYATTCNFNHPHYRIKSHRLNIFPGDKIQSRRNVLYIGDVPVAYLPFYNHSLKDNAMYVQLTPGYSGDWGPYLLSSTRYHLSESVQGRVYLDYRQRLGFAEGLGANYRDTGLGRGDLKLYYTQERPRDTEEGQPGEFQRYFARWRHRWDIDPQTTFTSEYYRIEDERRQQAGSSFNVLKDYFPREYERDPQPITYALLNHSFSDSSVNVYLEKRVNRWYSETEKLPEVTYSMPTLQLGSTPLYFENVSQAANYNKKIAAPSPSLDDESVNRLDTFNKASLPAKVSIFEVTPFVAERLTYYSKDNDANSIAARTVFYSGADVSTKFYRVFDVSSNFLNIEINRLRHVITPTLGYAYNNAPSVPSYRLIQVDSLDAIAKRNAVTAGLSNKLQTKRHDATVDVLEFTVDSTYSFYRTDPLTNHTVHDELSDILLELKLVPYSWLVFYSDADYIPQEHHFSTVNYSFNFGFAPERSLGLGQRYQYDGSNEVVLGSEWRLNPKWKLHLYQRLQTASVAGQRKGMVVQEYGFSRDLHCWLFEMTYSHEKSKGDSVWLVFKLKAFPEVGFDLRQGFNSPQSGSQTY